MTDSAVTKTEIRVKGRVQSVVVDGVEALPVEDDCGAWVWLCVIPGTDGTSFEWRGRESFAHAFPHYDLALAATRYDKIMQRGFRVGEIRYMRRIERTTVSEDWFV